MERLNYVEPEEADSLTRKLFRQVGMVPNLYSQMANSSMVFDGFLKLSGRLDASALDKRLREMVYLLVSEINHCSYCLASHVTTSVEHKVLTADETIDARRGESADPRTSALLRFARQVVERRGSVEDEVFEAVREQGFTDEEIVDCLGTIALATMSNYIALAGRPELDFLEPPPLEADQDA